MASSRNSKRDKGGPFDLATHVAARLKTAVSPGDRLLLGLSGGIDSIVLLDILARIAPRLQVTISALHVNHQLSPNAPQWARFCRAVCAARDIPCRVTKVQVARGDSTERAAREARYAAFRRSAADHVVLAHNADDQAETVLLQLLRGAGAKGLAAMPLVRRERVVEELGDGDSSSIVRPLLDVPRACVEDYAKRRKLEWIEDESNTDTVYLRNWLRHEIVPRIAERVPAYRAVLRRVARHFAELSEVLDEVADLDARQYVHGSAVAIEALRELSPARAKNLLRRVIARHGWRMPDADKLDEALRQALAARRDAQLIVNLGACELRRHGRLLHLLPATQRSAAQCVVEWQGERELALPALGGVLTMTPKKGAGLSAARLEAQPVTIRPREGGERLQPHPDRPRRTVKNLLQEARIPAWERSRLPFIYCGDTLACVPGVGVDHRFQARPGEASIVVGWRPHVRT